MFTQFCGIPSQLIRSSACIGKGVVTIGAAQTALNLGLVGGIGLACTARLTGLIRIRLRYH